MTHDIGEIIEALEQYTRGDDHQRAIDAAVEVLRAVESRESAILADVPVLVTSVMGLDVYDTPNGEPEQAVDAEDELREALKGLLASGGVIADASPDELQAALSDPESEPIVKTQAAAVLRARAALQASRQPQAQQGHAGVTAWIGDRTVSRIVTEIELRHERKQGEAVANAARRCLEELAALATKEPK